MNRLHFMLALPLLSTVLGCSASRPAQVVVVFVDVSASVKDFAAYRDAWSKITATLQPGDRLVLAQISDHTYTAFRPVLDSEIPTFSYWRDNKLIQETRVKALRETFAATLDRSLNAPRSSRTDIFGALLAAEKVFKGDHRPGTLVLLSDMLEDDEYNFEKARISDSFAGEVIAKTSRERRLPDLAGAAVYVAGASAKNMRKACEVQNFWLAYIKAANGRLIPEHYGPALVNFGE